MHGRGRHGLCIPPPRRAARWGGARPAARRPCVLRQVIYALTNASLSVQVQVQVQVQVSSLRRGRSARQLRYRPPCAHAQRRSPVSTSREGEGLLLALVPLCLSLAL